MERQKMAAEAQQTPEEICSPVKTAIDGIRPYISTLGPDHDLTIALHDMDSQPYPSLDWLLESRRFLEYCVLFRNQNYTNEVWGILSGVHGIIESARLSIRQMKYITEEPRVHIQPKYFIGILNIFLDRYATLPLLRLTETFFRAIELQAQRWAIWQRVEKVAPSEY
jgi:hypothetical protein